MYWAAIALFILPVWAMGQNVITGRITDSTGLALAGANIWLVESRQGMAADAAGRYRLESVRPGLHTVQVSFIGYATSEKIIRVEAGQGPATLDFVLREHSYQVDELVVAATRSDRQTPMTFVNLTEKQIAVNNLGQDVPFLLQWTPSTVVTSDAGTGVGYTGIRIRGTDPTRINVTINGIPLNDSESQAVYWVNLPDFATSVSDIQIQRGVGTSTNGAGAFGATINLNTSKVRHEPYTQANLSAGSFNTWKRNVAFGTGLLSGRFSIDGRLSRITSDGYIDRASSRLNSYYLSGAYAGARSLLRFNVFSGHEVTYQAWYGVPANLVDDWDTRTYNPAGTEKPGDPYDNEVDDYRQTHYQLLFNHQFNAEWNLNLAAHYTQGAGFYEQYKSDQQFADYGLEPVLINGAEATPDMVRRLWLDNDFYGGIYSLRYTKNGVDFTFGGGYSIYDGRHFGELVWSEISSNSEPGYHFYDNDGVKKDFNAYAKLSYPLARGLSAYGDLQFRRVDYEFLGYDRESRNVTQSDQLQFVNPKFGLSYAPDARQSWYASFAVAHREPNRDDYVESTPESRPKPEQLLNTEAGYRFSGPKAGLEVNLFHMYYRDQLVLNGQINDVGAYTRVNVDKSYRAGLEISGAWTPLSILQVQGNAAFTQNRVRAFREYLDDYVTDPVSGESAWVGQHVVEHRNTDLAFSPAIVAGLELGVEPLKNADWFAKQTFQLSWITRYVSRQFIDNTSDPSNAIPAYAFTNLRARYTRTSRLFRELELTALVQNLFNAQYVSNAWSYRYRYDGQTSLDQGFFPQAGVNFLVGLGVKW